MNEQNHEETVVRALLRDSAAAFPSGDADLFAGVAAGARRRRRRRLTLLGTAGAVLVIAAGAVSAVTMSAGRPGDTVQVEAAGADRPCPAQLGPLNASQRPGAADAMVPA